MDAIDCMSDVDAGAGERNRPATSPAELAVITAFNNAAPVLRKL